MSITEAAKAAKLVEEMMDMPPWNEKVWVRCALAVAARAIRRGRHLTNDEKWENLLKALAENDE